MLELGEVRAHRWIARRALGLLADGAPGGNPSHGLLGEEVAEILALYEEWGETDRSHRKLAHRGSYLGRVWVSPASVRRVGLGVAEPDALLTRPIQAFLGGVDIHERDLIGAGQQRRMRRQATQ